MMKYVKRKSISVRRPEAEGRDGLNPKLDHVLPVSSFLRSPSLFEELISGTRHSSLPQQTRTELIIAWVMCHMTLSSNVEGNTV